MANVSAAIAGTDAVISTLGAAKGSMMTEASRAVIAGVGGGIRRGVMLSPFTVLRSRQARLGPHAGRHDQGQSSGRRAAALERSRLDDRARLRLANGPAAGHPRVLPGPATLRLADTVTHAAMAAWLLAAVTDQSLSRRSAAIGG